MISKIDTSSPQACLDDWLKFRGEYKNPIFLCHPDLFPTVRKLHDDDHIYFYEPLNKLFGCPIHKTCEEGVGLYIVENNYRG